MEENEIMLWTGRGGAKARSSVITGARTPFIKYLAYSRSKKYTEQPEIEMSIDALITSSCFVNHQSVFQFLFDFRKSSAY